MAEKIYRVVDGGDFEEVQLPEFTCHKKVRGARITSIAYVNGNYRLTLDVGGHVDVSKLWVSSKTPEPNGFFVQYEDGYSSYLPATAFEEGYSPIEAEAAPVEAGQVLEAGTVADLQVEIADRDGIIDQLRIGIKIAEDQQKKSEELAHQAATQLYDARKINDELIKTIQAHEAAFDNTKETAPVEEPTPEPEPEPTAAPVPDEPDVATLLQQSDDADPKPSEAGEAGA